MRISRAPSTEGGRIDRTPIKGKVDPPHFYRLMGFRLFRVGFVAS